MTEEEKIDFVSFKAEEILEFLQDNLYDEFHHLIISNYDDIKKIEPLCKFLRIIRNDKFKMTHFLEKSEKKFYLFECFNSYQTLEKELKDEITIYDNLEILESLCEETSNLLIELLEILYHVKY